MQVDVVNQALGWLGKEPVADLTEASLTGSIAATKLMRSIEVARRTVLARHGWVCALEYATLAPWAAPEAYIGQNWQYPLAFLAPGGALRIWEVAGELILGRHIGPEPRWQLGSWETGPDSARQVIRVREGREAEVCEGGCLHISYVRDANWASLAPHVADAIAVDAAWRQCGSITSDAALQSRLAQQKESAVALAIGVDGTQEGGQPPLAPSIPARIRAYAGRGSNWPGGAGSWDR